MRVLGLVPCLPVCRKCKFFTQKELQKNVKQFFCNLDRGGDTYLGLEDGRYTKYTVLSLEFVPDECAYQLEHTIGKKNANHYENIS